MFISCTKLLDLYKQAIESYLFPQYARHIRNGCGQQEQLGITSRPLYVPYATAKKLFFHHAALKNSSF